ncbi:MAG: RidA family protein [Janthinobacterium lividum]
MIRQVATALLLSATLSSGAYAAGLERKSAPQAMIASSVTVPAGTTLVFLSGTTASPIGPANTAALAAYGNTEVQTMSIFTKMKTQLAEMGMDMGDVVKLTVFLVGDPEHGGKMDKDGLTRSYKKFFGTSDQPNLPARSAVQVAALGRPSTLVEIEAIVAKAR